MTVMVRYSYIQLEGTTDEHKRKIKRMKCKILNKNLNGTAFFRVTKTHFWMDPFWTCIVVLACAGGSFLFSLARSLIYTHPNSHYELHGRRIAISI